MVLWGPRDTEYIVTSEISIPKVDAQGARGVYSKGSQASQQGSRKAFLRK